MVVAFCGHAEYWEEPWHEERLLQILVERIKGEDAELLFGEYGAFDRFAFRCGRKYKKLYPCTKLLFVTPYPSEIYIRRRLGEGTEQYDGVIYPSLESVPKKYAIVHRNRYMIDCADLVIGYVVRKYGGAYDTYRYAEGKRKETVNLALGAQG